MKRSDAFPSRYMGKDDVTKPVIYHIHSVKMVDIGTNQEVEAKPVIYWEEPDAKPLIVNQTNWQTIEDEYGEEADNWTGKPVELYNDAKVEFMGKRVGGVRVHIPAAKGPDKDVPF